MTLKALIYNEPEKNRFTPRAKLRLLNAHAKPISYTQLSN
jgi:hypothetical protein